MRCSVLASALLSALALAVGLRAATNSRTPEVPLAFGSDGGFCAQATPPWLRSELGEEFGDLTLWGSGCRGEQGRIQSAPFLAPPSLSFYLSGDLGSNKLRLFLRSLSTGEDFDLAPRAIIGYHWQLETFNLPQAWVGQPVEMIGEDHSEVGWFAFSAPKILYSLLTPGNIPTDRRQGGFCRRGGIEVPWAGKGPPREFQPWRSYCDHGDRDTGWIATDPFRARSFVSLYVAGYPDMSDLRLAVENLQTHRQIALQVPELPRETWRLYHFPLPSDWHGAGVRVLAEDKSTKTTGWLGFALVPPSSWRDTSFALRLLLLMVGVLIIAVMPAAAVCAFAVRRGISRSLDLTAIGLLTVGFTGYGAFWAYFFNDCLGLIFSYGVAFVSLAYVAYASVWLRRKANFAPLRHMSIPLLLLATASVFIVSLGFVYGKSDPVQGFAAARFGPPTLDLDNFLPKIFADGVYSGHIPRPMYGDWLSSDRPPLQTGIAVFEYPWTHPDRDLAYQLLGVVLQLTFLTALWAYLDAAGINRKAVALIMLSALFSGFTIFNSFYVWPKLLPVSFLLLTIAYLFTGDYQQSWKTGVVVGAAAGLALLCHGGSAFGLIGIGLAAMLLRRIPGKKCLFFAIITAASLYLPWLTYQKFYDPPGDRLLKWHLAGTVKAHPEIAFSRLLAEKYRELGWSGTLNHKLHNFVVLVDPRPDFGWGLTIRAFIFGNHEQRAAAIADLRFTMFIHWMWSIDLLSLGLVALLFCLVMGRRKPPEYRHACILWLVTALTLVVWCLLMFGYGGTIVHQGCYLTEIAAFTAAILTFWTLNPKLAAVITCLHGAFTIVVYAVQMPPRPVGMGTWFGPINAILAWVAVSAAAVFALTSWHAAFRLP